MVIMSDHNPLTLKLNLREKIAYGMGDVGSNLMLCIGTLYLLKFYTDELGMPAYYGGIIFLVAKFFTAFTDMLTGFLLDSRKNIGPKGKFRPFILYAAVPAALIATLQFIATTFCLPTYESVVGAFQYLDDFTFGFAPAALGIEGNAYFVARHGVRRVAFGYEDGIAAAFGNEGVLAVALALEDACHLHAMVI